MGTRKLYFELQQKVIVHRLMGERPLYAKQMAMKEIVEEWEMPTDDDKVKCSGGEFYKLQNWLDKKNFWFNK